ncbi:MAG: aminotransferase class I/II-fold pyridoxal phosphate-dependent enzyme [Chloroflexi bacterium]|nr:aminotransferase class I/II-fold pyridoxal phosphate-dependent enzyme [Chloroflexota bacterium]
MDSKSDIERQLKDLIKQYFDRQGSEDFQKGKTPIKLITPSYGYEEVAEALECLLSTQVTMARKVQQFEAMFAEYIGMRHAVMVNSGSSANLLALSILTNPAIKNRIKPGDEVITPAVTWATTVWPIVNCGAVPVLVDIGLDTFNLNVDEVRKAITRKTRAIMLVHLLGNPCDIMPILELAREHNLYVIEDSCEAHGAEVDGRKVGSFGDISTFSFFFSHHISTMEGGMVLTNNQEFGEMARAMRVFGWIRDLKEKDRIATEHQDIDRRFLFTNIGYNFRPTELQGGFGIHQLGKLEPFIKARQENSQFWHEQLKKHEKHILLHQERKGTRHVWFGYPITVRPDAPFSRKDIVDFLENKKVETRPIMAGNIVEQPAMGLIKYRTAGELPNSRLVMRNSFFFGNHQAIGPVERSAIVEYFDEFMAGISRS